MKFHSFITSGLLLALFLLLPGSLWSVPIKNPSPVLRSGDLFPHISLPNVLSQEEKKYLGLGGEGSLYFRVPV